MKITCLLLMVALVQVSASTYSQSTKLTLNLKNVTLSEIFQEIEKTSEFRFFYDSNEIDPSAEVSVKTKDSNIENILNDVFNNSDVTYKIIDRYVVLNKKGTEIDVSTVQQQTSISGKVSDEDGEPLPGVTVLIKGTTNGTVTNMDGNYSIANVPENTTLQFSFVGMLTQEIVVGGQSTINVTMAADAIGIEEVVAIGYGTVKRSDVTGAVSSVKGDNITNIQLPRVEQQLQTQVAGLNVSTSNTAPGGTIQMRIRGSNSIQGNNNPLIVIDGMIGGDLKYLNSNDIESVEVLKDASSTAIYGSRGANGVIIVTTKNGKSGKLEVSFNGYYGIQQVTKKIDVMNTEEWLSIINANPNTPIDPTDVDTDWQDEIFQTAAIQNYQLSVSGGGKTNSYLFSTNYFNQDGVVKNSNYERLTLRLNFKQEIGEHITVGNNITFSRSGNQRIHMNEGYGNSGEPATNAALMVPPIIPVYDEDGNYAPNYLFSTSNNPVAIINERDDHVTRNYLLGNAFVDIKFLEKFTYHLNLGYKVNNRLDRKYDGKMLTSSNKQGKASVATSDVDDVLLENTLNYSTIINDNHSLNILAGATAQNTSGWYSGITGTGFSSDELGYYGLTNAESFSNIYTNETNSKILSFLGRINYAYKNKYYITASGRQDGASVFAENQKWAFFPSFSLGWRLTSESFLQGINKFADIKVRGGYGKTGSQAIRPYQSLAIYDSGIQFTTGEGNIFNNGTRPLRLANNDLRWETTSSYNVGLNTVFLDGRLQLIADYYVKETNDLLYDKESPKYSGYSSQTQNIGTIKNSGFEIEVLANNNFGELNWDAGFNIFTNKNEVIDLGGDDLIPLYSGSSFSAIRQSGLLTIGQPMGAFYGYVFEGIYQNEEEVNAIDDPTAAPGRVKFKDINNDGKIDINDKTIIGTPHPDFVWGFRNSLTYRNVNLSFNLRGVHGSEVFWTGKYQLLGGEYQNGLTERLNYWNGDGTSNTMQGIGEERGLTSTRYVEDGSYIRLQNISLGYNLPQKLAKSLFVNSCNVYISAQNLFTITNYPGYDPEVNSRGGNDDLSNQNTLLGYDHGSYPGTRTFTVGLNVKF